MTHPVSPFPVLTSDAEMRQAVAHKDEIKFMLQANGTTVCSYVVSMESTFDDPYSREARGIVFDASGKVISRPLHKFHNVNEKPATLIENLDWTQVVRVMDKRDGSMIHTVNIKRNLGPLSMGGFFDGEGASFGDANFDVKSKKSFTSDVANSAREFIDSNQNYFDFCSDITSENRTAVFEWTSPYARIVLAYGKNELKLLHVRDNVTGEYMSPQLLKNLAEEFHIPTVDDLPFNNGLLDVKVDTGSGFVGSAFIDFNAQNREIQFRLQELVEQACNVEGWVFQFKNGDMVKLKTKWYMERHRAMTFLRERDIALMVLRESLDDLKAMLVGEGANISEILTIEERTVAMLNTIQNSIELAFESKKHLDRKNFALYFQTSNDGDRHPYFGLLMQKYSGKEPDYKGWYERNVLPDIPLKQLNLMQSIAEEE